MKWTESIKEIIRRSRSSKYGWSGDYSNWQEASRSCSGYDSDTILKKVKQSALKVKQGEAAYERDSVLFDTIEYSWPLLSGLMWIAAQNKGTLKVADFGGSLGSSYFQNKIFLDPLDTVQWNVIEQNNFVKAGKEFIEDATLRFYHTLDQCIAERGVPDVLLLSCVLPYLEEPYQVLERLTGYHIAYILVDNTYFNYEERDRICVQKVSPQVYEASYPCWFLHYEHLKKILGKEYIITSEHRNDSIIFLDGKKINYRGLLAKYQP